MILQHGPLASAIPHNKLHEVTCHLVWLSIASNQIAPASPGTQCVSFSAAMKRTLGGSRRGGVADTIISGTDAVQLVG